MDLGIAGKWALVCGASKGLGLGCAQALVREGVNLVINARNPDALALAASDLRAAGASAAGARGQKEGLLNRYLNSLIPQAFADKRARLGL